MQHNQSFLFFVACVVSIGGILYGYDMGVVSGALLFIQDAIPMTTTQVGLIVGAVLGGALIGTLLAGPIGDYFGRRILFLSSTLIVILGVNLVIFAHSFVVMFCARLLLGVGVGIVAVAVPLYVAEIVPASHRGKYISFFQLLLTFGILLAYFIDLLFTPTRNWRAMFAVVLVPSVILLIGIFFLPESPRWLIAKNKIHRARKILARIYSSQQVEIDIQAIQQSLIATEGSWRELFAKPFWLPSILAILIAVFNQLTGINSFLQYAPLILKEAGISSNLLTMVGSVGIGLINFISTFIAMMFIDSVGRRPLLLTGISGVIASLAYLGVISFLPLDAYHTGLLSLIGLFCFILFFAIGPGMVVWVTIAELFPTRVRGKGIALCLFFNSLCSTLLSTFFLHLSQTIGISQTYWLFAFFSMGYFLLIFFLLPETKSKSLEEIQSQFQK